MATSLQQLISHYDLCITALKHTEGGGEAARAATSSTTADTQHDPEAPEESLYRSKHREPISALERTEMLTVLQNDAIEVEDVVHEIGARAAEMEVQLTHLSSHASTARKAHIGLKKVLDMLRTVGDQLPSHVQAARSFRSTWSTLQESIIARTEELASLTTFYESFSHSYTSLLREVERRAMVEGKMRKIADRARKEIEALYAEDVDMRGQFVKDVGEFLPRDIWPGLVDKPGRWEVRCQDEVEDQL